MELQVEQIFDFLGRSKSEEGTTSDKNLRKILKYLCETQEQGLNTTLARLPLLIGANKRYIRENFIEGLISFGVIKVSRVDNTWVWVGLNGADF